MKHLVVSEISATEFLPHRPRAGHSISPTWRNQILPVSRPGVGIQGSMSGLTWAGMRVWQATARSHLPDNKSVLIASRFSALGFITRDVL